MSYIMVCKEESCPAKELCYRYTAKPNQYRQSYMMVTPIEEGECRMFWPNNDNDYEKGVELIKQTKK